MKKFIIDNKGILLVTIIISILLPIIILWDCPFVPGIIPENIGNAIFSLSGAIISGLLAIYGGWWVMNEQKKAHEKEEKEKLSNEYKPIPFGNTVSLKSNKNEDIPMITLNNDSYNLIFGISIENQGRGELQNGHIIGHLVRCEGDNAIIPEVILRDGFIATGKTGLIEVHALNIPLDCSYIEFFIQFNYFGLYSTEQNCLFKVISEITRNKRKLEFDMDIVTYYDTKLPSFHPVN